MKKREDHDDRHLLLPENDGGEDDFDPFGPKAVVTLPVPKTTVGTHSDKAISNVTVMPAMRLTWHSICAKPKSMVKSEKTCTSSLKDFFGIQEIEKEKKLVPRAMILKNCFGVAYPGEVLALMGSSGAGKTTLMNILTQRNLGTVVTSGTIQINEVDVDRSTLRKLSAYVQQDDLFIGTMTVAEHLHFTAMMKMGRNYTSRERNRRVKMVINDLNLTKCANTLIGNPRRGIKGISGGERKRLAFASEIMTSPPLLFCDEPTSGLDSYMARHTVEVLKQLATKKNMTIICTIHQPSSQLFALFDRICFLADGRTAFHGSIPEAVQLWKSLGDPVPEKSNPADHFVNTLSILTGKKYEESQRRVMKICDSYLESPVGQRVFQLTKSESGSTSSLESIWQNNDKLKEKTYQRYKATWCQQFFGLFKRSLLGNMRDPVVLHVRVFQTVVIALTMGAIYFDTQISQRTVMNVNGALFQVIMNMNFMFQFTTVHMFCDELPTFL
uniref:ABC transporter domain-containing protein n=1 Tax=Panagrolaimus sp. JU765 TaxID=591449 RepID=A0AC34QYN6_9BILA